MNTDINDLTKNLKNLQIVPFKKNKKYNVDLLIVSMNKMKIGKKKIVKNNVINNIYTKYELYSLLNKKLFMDEIFGPVLLRYFQRPIKILKMIPEENNYDADDSIIE
jgi:hypothetical protein